MTQAYPLLWPQGFPRAKSRSSSRFKATISSALDFVEDELRRFGNDTGKRVESLVISSNYSLTDRNPKDPGVGVYFRWDNIDVCIPADQYARIEENLQAVARVIEAQRAILRHGGLNIVRASFRGFASLPPPKGPDGQLERPWWMVLAFDAAPTLVDAEARYRELVKTKHPDRGGDPAEFNAVTDAIRKAREELRS
jgi:hypothetical protein